MVSSSKILTVSYGTFSCTAEGFEDPLAVVKETTHFFRGVVGNDRFFGAEPPQFDSEMATEMMRAQLAQSSEHGEGKLTLGSPIKAASSSALSAALAAGPTRRAADPEPPTDTLPDDDTIEATAVLTEIPLDTAEAPLPEVPTAIVDEAPKTVVETPLPQADDTAHQTAYQPDVAETSDDSFIADTVAAATAEVTAPAPRPSTSESVAAKLDRIRAVVASNDAQEANIEDGYDADETDEVDPAFIATAEMPVRADTNLIIADDNIPGEEEDDDALTALLGEFDNDRAPETDNTPTAALTKESAAPEWDEDRVLADTIASLMGDTTAGTHSAEPEILPTNVESTADEIFEAPTAADDNNFDAWDTADVTTGHVEDAIEAADLPNVPEEDVTPEAPEPAQAPLRARVVKVKRADFQRAVEQGALEEIDKEDETEAADASADRAGASPVPMSDESTLSPEEEDELARELAAVKAELSGEFDDWDEDEDDEDATRRLHARFDEETTDDDTPIRAEGWDDEASYYEDDDEEDGQSVEPGPFRLDNPLVSATGTGSEEDEDDDARMRWPADLDAIDARMAGSLGTPDRAADKTEDGLEEMIRDSARKTVKMASPARVMLTEREVKDDDTSRLMEQTDTEMEEPEGNRRRTAIAHLRAAVAATKADRLLGRRADAAEVQEPYREDLANVVRPRRPQAAPAARTERPVEQASRPAPLKLVAEQRVEDESARKASVSSDLPRTVPVRPRRVQRVADVESRETGSTSDSDGFVVYAEQVGATELPELLEAAAAYMAYVEGRDQFSRPQLMSTVRLAEAQESSREDRLRSFGQLLREGKIKKTSGGRFTASDRISFKPDRAAG
ncbi:hypothetical protein J4E08_09810 [Sagittula sp. NFXS13]|uniref:hypothetical protein n=1 Tax=Sagittula sp. NFXS13 TaxID=2819095 RepID=UPI0032DE3DAE